MTLIPRIDVTTIFSGSTRATERAQDFIYYGCNDSYYDVSAQTSASAKCQELINMASIEVHNGATRKYFFKSYLIDVLKTFNYKSRCVVSRLYNDIIILKIK